MDGMSQTPASSPEQLEEHAKNAIGEAAELAGPAAAIISVLADLVAKHPDLRVQIDLGGDPSYGPGRLTVATAGGAVDYFLVDAGDGNLEARIHNVQVTRGATW